MKQSIEIDKNGKGQLSKDDWKFIVILNFNITHINTKNECFSMNQNSEVYEILEKNTCPQDKKYFILAKYFYVHEAIFILFIGFSSIVLVFANR